MRLSEIPQEPSLLSTTKSVVADRLSAAAFCVAYFAEFLYR